jgi:hypothetical protein
MCARKWTRVASKRVRKRSGAKETQSERTVSLPPPFSWSLRAAPAIIKCFNYWEEEQTNSMVFITELIEGTKGVGPGNAACVHVWMIFPFKKQ